MVKIFVGRLTEEATKSEVEELFKAFGEVTDCSVLKNYGFVHMASLDEAQAAIAGLDKFEFHGNKINVELSTTKVVKACKLFVGNLPPDTKSADIHKLFKTYGTVIECDVVKNYAFVHMGREADAREAIAGLKGTDFNGNDISVEMSRTVKRSENYDGPRSHGDPWAMRGRGRGFMGMPPMRGGPRFRGRPFMQDPYLGANLLRRGGMRPRVPFMQNRTGATAYGAMYDRDLIARRNMLLGAGDPFVMREREALARRLDAYSAAGLAADMEFDANYGAFGLDQYSAY